MAHSFPHLLCESLNWLGSLSSGVSLSLFTFPGASLRSVVTNREHICDTFSLYHSLSDPDETRLCLVPSPGPFCFTRFLTGFCWDLPQAKAPHTALAPGSTSRELVLWPWPMLVLLTWHRTDLFFTKADILILTKSLNKEFPQILNVLQEIHLEQEVPVLFGVRGASLALVL